MPMDPSVATNAGPPEGSMRPLAAPGGEDGPFPVPSPHAGTEGLSELPVADPAPALCGFEHDQWDIVRMRRRCIAPAGHTTGQFAYDHGPWQTEIGHRGKSAPTAPPTPPAARESAPQRPNAAREPEVGADATAERETDPLAVVRDHVQHLHHLGNQLAAARDGLTEVESWFWNHLADVRDATDRGDGLAADDELHVTDETLIQFPTDANVARRELARIQDVARRYREQARKAERAANLLAGSHRRADEVEAVVARVQALAADMRTWCSPHGIATDYADRIDEAITGGPDAQHA